MKLVSINPATGEKIAEFKTASLSDVKQAVEKARVALPSWSSKTPWQRAEYLERAADLLVADAERIKKLITAEMGKPLPESETEVLETADMLRFFARSIGQGLEGMFVRHEVEIYRSKMSYSSYFPVGVVAAIEPWNYPLELPVWTIGAALVTGNTVVFKPSEVTPMVGKILFETFRKAEFPDNVLNLVIGGGEVGRWLVRSDIDMVAFTGSQEVGKEIKEVAGEKLIRSSLELGGKNPFIVCSDADLEEAVNGAVWGACANCGQVCVANGKMYVHRSIYQKLVDLVVAKVKALRIGNPLGEKVDIGPLANAKQLEKVEGHVKDALSKGAKALVGGKRPRGSKFSRGFFFLPTVLVDVSEEMDVVKKETFGPVINIQPYGKAGGKDKEEELREVLKKEEKNEYGLAASVWTRDLKKALFLSENLSVGTVWINEINVAYPQLPWTSGRKSGGGVGLSKEGLKEFMKERVITYDFSGDIDRSWWFPFSLVKKIELTEAFNKFTFR